MSEGPDQLSSSDMSSLLSEQGAIHVHVGGTAIFDGDPPPFEEFLAHVGVRLELIPRFRRRVRWLPGKIMRAEWEDDPDFDLRRHVRHVAIPSPGADQELRDLVGQVMSEPLDQSRPLWQIYLVERCGAGRKSGFAAISKTHHALVDGVSAVDVGAIILDPDPDGTDLGLTGAEWSPQATRSDQAVLADRVFDARRKLFGMPREAARRAFDVSAPQSAFKTAQGFFDLAMNSEAVRPTIINEEIGRDRRVAFAATTLASLKEVATSSDTGATVNDVVLAVSTGALRRLFEHRGAEIPRDFSALVPMSIRKPGEELELGNRITTLMVPLPLSEPDAAERLRRIHETTDRLKRSEAARAASLVIEASGWVPPTMTRVLGSVSSVSGAALGPMSGLVPQRIPWNLVISNVPGPPMQVYLLGRRLKSIHPFVPLSPQRRALSIGVISYNGGLYFGLVGDRDRMSDLDIFASFIDKELTALGAVTK
jgi:diacylglycerol O-acyltransferase